jgi:hypothetical protein
MSVRALWHLASRGYTAQDRIRRIHTHLAGSVFLILILATHSRCVYNPVYSLCIVDSLGFLDFPPTCGTMPYTASARIFFCGR